MKGLVVQACGRRFWLPLEAVLFVARAGGERGVLRLPRASAPIVSLAERLNLSARQSVRYAVVLRGARIAYALAVEEVLGLEARDASGAQPLVPADLLSAEEEERLASASAG